MTKNCFKFISIFLILNSFAIHHLHSFVLQAKTPNTPNTNSGNRKLSFMDLFRSKTDLPPSPSVNRILQLLQLADTFTQDPNFSVNVDVTYKNTGQTFVPPKTTTSKKARKLNDNQSKNSKHQKTKFHRKLGKKKSGNQRRKVKVDKKNKRKI